MEEDNYKTPSPSWIKHLEDVKKEYLNQHDKLTLKRTMGWRQTPYVTGNIGIDPYDVIQEEKPIAVNMDDYIHKDEMVQILLDSRHALFTDRIPSVLEVIEWIEERKKKQIM
jgi:hypothetical protein